MNKRRALPVLLGAIALTASACGGSEGGSTSTQTAKIQGAKVLGPSAMDNAKQGTIAYCTGKDTTGALHRAVKEFNARYRAQGLGAKLIEFSPQADQQRAQFIQRARAKSDECDLFYADDTWTAEFATQKWIYDLTPYIKSRASELVPSVADGVKYAGRYWAVPKQTDASFLYYRTDKVAKAPSTWQQLYGEAKSKGGYVYQGASYEGLTVDYLEVALAAGGQVLSPDGKHSVIDSPQNRQALQLMVDGMKSGATLKAVPTYMEEDARRAFEAGKAAFERNWPYAYPLAKMSKVKSHFAVSPLPAWQGGGRGQVIGSRNLVISAYSKNPGGALKLADFLTSPRVERDDAVKYAVPPVLVQTYHDAAVKKALPYAGQLLNAVEHGTARPASPVYAQISEAIYKNVNAALSGQTSPQDALAKANTQINQALSSF